MQMNISSLNTFSNSISIFKHENGNQVVPKKENEIKSKELSKEENEQIVRLRKRDQEVRIHEAAHQASAGGYAGGASYSYQIGPDGKSYAIGGEVSIDISPIPNNPEGTIQKMQVIRRAALAPSEPSTQDRAVATKATQIEQQARAEIIAKLNTSTDNSRTPFVLNESTKITNGFENKNIFFVYSKNSTQQQGLIFDRTA